MTEKQNELSPSNQDASAIENLATIKHRIVVFSGKGGVGKPTVSVNLAYALKALGFNSAILDADITGHNVPKMLGVNERTPISKGRFQPHEHEGVKIISTASLISSCDLAWTSTLKTAQAVPPRCGVGRVRLSHRGSPTRHR